MSQATSYRLLDHADTTGPGPVQNFEFTAVTAAAVQAKFEGVSRRVEVSLMARLAGDMPWAPIATIDTASGFASGDIAMIKLPAAAVELHADVLRLDGGGSVTLHFRAIQ